MMAFMGTRGRHGKFAGFVLLVRGLYKLLVRRKAAFSGG